MLFTFLVELINGFFASMSEGRFKKGDLRRNCIEKLDVIWLK